MLNINQRISFKHLNYSVSLLSFILGIYLLVAISKEINVPVGAKCSDVLGTSFFLAFGVFLFLTTMLTDKITQRWKLIFKIINLVATYFIVGLIVEWIIKSHYGFPEYCTMFL